MSPLVKTEVVIGENTTQVLTEATVSLLLTATKVRNVSAAVVDIVTNVLPDNVIVQGLVRQHIFYVGSDTVIHYQIEDVPFCTYVVVSGAQPGMTVKVYPTVERVLFDLNTEGDTVGLRSILDILVEVTQERQMSLKEGDGPRYLFSQVVGENTREEAGENTTFLTLPALKITDLSVRLDIASYEVIPDKVIVEGSLHKEICYVAAEDSLEHHLAENVPFATFIDVPGAEPGMTALISPKVEEITYDLSSDGTEVSQKVALELFVKVTQDVESALATGTTLIKAQEVVGEDSLHTLVESTYALAPAAQKVNEIRAEVKEISTNIIPSKVIVQGTLHKVIYFTGLDDINYEQEEDVPFLGFVQIPGAVPGMSTRVIPKVRGVIHELSADGENLAQKVMLEVGVKVLRLVQAAVAEVSAG